MMRNKDYFREIGMEPEDLSKTLDLASDRIFMLNRFSDQNSPFRTKSRKATYRILSRRKKTAIGC